MRKLFYLFVSFILIVSLLCTCMPDIKLPGTLYGVVADKVSGEPINAVEVKLQPNGTTITTSANGYFEFTKLAPGGYALEVSKKGYKSDTTSLVSVLEGENVEVDIKLEMLPPSLRIINDKKEDIDTLNFGYAKDDIARTFSIFNDGEHKLEWKLTYTAAWVKSVSDTFGIINSNLTQPIVVIIDRQKLADGENTTTLHITSNNGSKSLIVNAIGKVLPKVNTNSSTEIGSTSVTLNGKIVEKGLPRYTERGFIYSQRISETTNDSWIWLKSTLSEDDEYTYHLKGLHSNTLYDVRAYVISDTDTVFGGVVSFKTTEVISEVKTEKATNITSSSAILRANVLEKGVPCYSERGFCYSKEEEPEIEDVKIKVEGTEIGEYEAKVNNLDYNTKYFVRSYLIQDGDIKYGNQIDFETVYIKTSVITSAVSDIQTSNAVFNGGINTKGDPIYTERGFCYSSDNDMPTINDSKLVDKYSNGKEGSFSMIANNLSYGVNYKVRAYAIQDGEERYGDVETFSTLFTKTVVSTSMVSQIDLNTAVFNGVVEEIGTPSYSEKGFCYATVKDPTIYHKKIRVDANANGSYHANVDDLDYKTKYFVRAYAIQNGEVLYGNNVEFTTLWESAIVKTSNAYHPGLGMLTMAGYVVSKGYPSCSESGFVAKQVSVDEEFLEDLTDADLIPNDYYPYTYGNVFEGEFTKTFTVDEQSLIVYQAYVVQNMDTIKGEIYYVLPHSRPVVKTENPQEITSSSMIFLGNVEWFGNPKYTEVGFVWSLEDTTPTIGEYGCGSTSNVQLIEGTTLFGGRFTGIPANTPICYRAYIINAYGTFYGNSVIATTLP